MKQIAIVFIIFTLLGCDTLGGVIRSAKIKNIPDMQCIEAAIKSAPNVSNVMSENLYISNTYRYTFNYTGYPKISGKLEIYQSSDGSFNFVQSRALFNSVPPQVEIAATLPVMKFIEKAVEDKCGVTNLSKDIDEYCSSVICN